MGVPHWFRSGGELYYGIQGGWSFQRGKYMEFKKDVQVLWDKKSDTKYEKDYQEWEDMSFEEQPTKKRELKFKLKSKSKRIKPYP